MGISLPQTGQGCVGMRVSGSSFMADTSGFELWRRKQDSNLRWVAPHLFSRQTPSASRSFRHMDSDRPYLRDDRQSSLPPRQRYRFGPLLDAWPDMWRAGTCLKNGRGNWIRTNIILVRAGCPAIGRCPFIDGHRSATAMAAPYSMVRAVGGEICMDSPLVEIVGFEPATSCLQSKRSTN